MAPSTAARQAVFTYLDITQEINFYLDMIPMVSEHSPCLLSLLHLALCYPEMLASGHPCTLASPPPLVFRGCYSLSNTHETPLHGLHPYRPCLWSQMTLVTFPSGFRHWALQVSEHTG